MKKQIYFMPTIWVALIAMCIIALDMEAQNTPPPMHWQFTAESQKTQTPTTSKEDWIYNLIQASDGSLVAVGFSEGQNSVPRPTIFKYFNNTKQVKWEKFLSENPSTCPNGNTSGKGNYQDVIEANGNYYAVGYATNASTTCTGEEIWVAKIPIETGLLQGASVNLTKLQATRNGIVGSSRAYSIRTISTGGFIVCGTVTTDKPYAFIMKLKPDLTKDLSFGTNNTGTVTFDDNTFGRQAIVHYTGTTPDRFYLIGDKDHVAGLPVNDANRTTDVYLTATELDGTIIPGFPKTYEDLTIGSVPGYSASAKTTTVCSNRSLADVQNVEHGIGIEQVGTQFILSTQFKAFKGFGQECQNIGTNGYFDVDAMLIKINLAGEATWCKRAAYFNGIDFNTPVKVKNGEYYLLGSHLDNANSKAYTTLVNIKEGGAMGWQKDYLSDKDGAKWNCPFGLAITADGGFAIGGNNDLNDEDYYILKLRSECQNNLTFDIPNGKDITVSETWSTNAKVKGKIVVKAGQTLRIQSCTIEFASSLETNDYQKLALNNGSAIETKIIVEPNGRLILQNATLRGIQNTCGKDWMWEGIEVRGDPSQMQTNSLQGSIGTIGLNNQIRDAIVGLSMSSKSFNADGNVVNDNYQGGGIADVKLTRFINCRKSVWFAPYSSSTADNVSKFDNTRFETTNAMVDENYININAHRLGVNDHVSMYAVKGITFNDCYWSDNYDGVNGLSGIGIKSWDANAYITSGSKAVDKTTPNFSNLAWGIDAGFSTSADQSYSISKNLFKNVNNNIRILHGSNTNINDNIFKDIPDISLATGISGYGIMLTESQMNSISRNKFFGTQGSTKSFNIGILADNTSAAISNFVSNEFTDLQVGNQMQRSNSGMSVRCNNYTRNSLSALQILKESTTDVFNDQGECGSSGTQAGNIFNDRVCDVIGRHIYSTLDPSHAFTYNYRANQPNEVPDCVFGLVNTHQCNLSQTNSNNCPQVGIVVDNGCFYYNGGWLCTEAVGNFDEIGIPVAIPFPIIGGTPIVLGNQLTLSLTTSVNTMTNDANRMLAKGSLIRMGQGVGDTAFVATILASENATVFKKIAAGNKIKMKKNKEARDIHKELLKQNKISKDYSDFHAILSDLSDDNKHVKQLSNAQIAKIRAISNGNSEVKYTAIGLLAFLEDKTYPDVIERRRNDFGNNSEGTSAFAVKAQSTGATTMQLTPNPTQAVLNVKLPNMELSNDAQLIVTNMFGRTLKTVELGQVTQYSLDVQDVPNGIYFCTLLSNKKVVEVQKFSIIK